MRQKEELEKACEHCGALVMTETKKCPQCGKFPIRLHLCSQCQCISPAETEKCWKCGHIFMPLGEFL